MKQKRRRLKIFLNCLAAVLAVVALYLLLAPFWDVAVLPVEKILDPTNGYHYENTLMNSDNVPVDKSKLKPIPKFNALVIPKIEVDAEIHEGATDSALGLGVWRKPDLGTPASGGNTVLTAHRFMYLSGPNTFYHLGDLVVGDKFMIYWEGKEFDYQVTESTTVKPTDTWVENNTTTPMVTLYTCTYQAESRILIRAKPINL